jgi:hypothetical protein
MRYPVVNCQALGRTTVFGRPLESAAPRRLGNPEEFEKAKAIWGRTKAAYQKLVQIFGVAKADQAVQEAQEAMDRAAD